MPALVVGGPRARPSAVGSIASRHVRIGAAGSVRRPVELGVALAQQPEGVLVVAEPQVQPVLLDPAVRTAAARSLAAEAPAPLVDGDRLELVLASPARSAATRPPSPPCRRRGSRPGGGGTSPRRGQAGARPLEVDRQRRPAGNASIACLSGSLASSPRRSWRSSAIRSSNGRAPCDRASLQRRAQRARPPASGVGARWAAAPRGLGVVEAHAGPGGEPQRLLVASTLPRRGPRTRPAAAPHVVT